jgi:hypothetical protein
MFSFYLSSFKEEKEAILKSKYKTTTVAEIRSQYAKNNEVCIDYTANKYRASELKTEKKLEHSPESKALNIEYRSSSLRSSSRQTSQTNLTKKLSRNSSRDSIQKLDTVRSYLRKSSVENKIVTSSNNSGAKPPIPTNMKAQKNKDENLSNIQRILSRLNLHLKKKYKLTVNKDDGSLDLQGLE